MIAMLSRIYLGLDEENICRSYLLEIYNFTEGYKKNWL